jgi:hypothetical protein
MRAAGTAGVGPLFGVTWGLPPAVARRRTSSPATRPGPSPPTSPSCRSY